MLTPKVGDWLLLLLPPAEATTITPKSPASVAVSPPIDIRSALVQAIPAILVPAAPAMVSTPITRTPPVTAIIVIVRLVESAAQTPE